MPVGCSKAPIAIAMVSRPIGSQNRKDPQVEQKPRRTFSDERYQVTASPPWTVTAARGRSVEAQKWPDCRRHCEQWQASGGRSSPVDLEPHGAAEAGSLVHRCSFLVRR